MSGDGHAQCWYCETLLATRHEHDHVPPQRHGGDDTVPACVNCHDLKDRMPLADWPDELVREMILAIPPGPGRVLMAKLHALTLDMEADDALLAAVEYEGELISNRTSAALAARRAAGVRLGRAPQIPAEVVRRIVDERAAGTSIRGIAANLNADGIPTVKGKPWGGSTVQAVLAGQDAAKLTATA